MERPVIDADRWPLVATTPDIRFASIRARRAEAAFAAACRKANLSLSGDDPDLEVRVEDLFVRIAASGWVGLAESYMAEEWSTPRLVSVVRGLLQAGYAPRTPHIGASPSSGGELPAELVRLYNPDPFGHQGGIYSTGVPTTVRSSQRSYARRGPAAHFVDITQVSEPTAVDREDLAPALERGARWLLNAAHVDAGTHTLVWPAAGAQAAVLAAQRNAVVDLVSADAATLQVAREHMVLSGVADNVHCQLVDAAVPSRKQFRGRYDAIVSVGLFDTLNGRERATYFGTLERLLAPQGRAVIHTAVATEALSPAARGALETLRAYVWPNAELLTVDEVHKLADRTSGLRIIEQRHTAAHAQETLAQQRSFFAGKHREAAAAGFDSVYRRLWTFQLALREALLSLGMIDSVQFTAVHRNRHGRR